jgi:hypothetical protein
MFGMLMIFFSDTTSVDIRALVSQDIERAARNGLGESANNFVGHIFGMSETVLAVELALIIIMAVLFVGLIFRFRKMSKEQKKKLESAHRMAIKRPSVISRVEIERILNEIASEKGKLTNEDTPDKLRRGSGYFINDSGKLDSDMAIHEMAHAKHTEADRLNFAISYAARAGKQPPSNVEASNSGTKFKEAFAAVTENSDLNVLARQLNMGRGELELILALKKSKIANSKIPTNAASGGRWRLS